MAPEIAYPPELPIVQRKDDIAAAIREHQVVVIAGETGSGKTTQLPKICLELGRGRAGKIGHTQPRRIAARTVAERIANELKSELGTTVGWKVRFTDQVSAQTQIKLMTDGILLAELAADRLLRGYDTLIIDEAHERSLNVDFILGYLKQLLPKRPDLKVIITSATIDPDRFAAHFDAPIIEVSGRTYPVEIRYRPWGDDADTDQVQAICDAVDELSLEPPGDILIFLSGEREIRDTADALRRMHLTNIEILPLFARLSAAEQHRVFRPHRGRRIVLATNVAETSLTVPGIKYVIDPGTARISRYSSRLKVQRLPIEPISRASASQRAGRCGRTSDGVCIRLYDEKDFTDRPEFTEPEILRTNLASVILQMTALRLGEVADFPFLDPPDRRQIADGVALLEELGALETATKDQARRLTKIGSRLAQLPIDPRLGRMVLAAEHNGCLREVLIITSGLTIVDPRERPADKEQHAAQLHARFTDKTSDFMSLVNLWDYLREQQRELSSSQFRKMCRADFLHYLRVREWQDLHAQLRQVVRRLGVAISNTPAGEGIADRVHESLLAGLLSHIGLYDPEKRDYLGARGARFAIFPGSVLFKRNPRWIMAGELVETSRLWGRMVASITPEWAELQAQHLVKRQYSEPHWEKKPAAVIAYEKVTLYGVPIVARRKVNFGRVDPALSRELFIRHALVEGDWDTHHEFFHTNQELLGEVEELEHRVRRRDVLADDETLFAFYDQRLPADIVSGRHFDSWWKKTRRTQPDLLTFTKDLLIATPVSVDAFPDTWHHRVAGELLLTYQFEPGDAADGVTVHIPLPLLPQLDARGFDWQVPGLREDLAISLIRSLPKAVRRNFVPVPDYARAILAEVSPDDGPLTRVLADRLRKLTGTIIPPDAWDWTLVPDHLRLTFQVDTPDGARDSKDLAELQRTLSGAARAAVADKTDELTRTGHTSWDFGTLSRVVERRHGAYDVKAFPALIDEGMTVGVQVLGSEGEQWTAMWQGTRRLLRLVAPAPLKSLQGRLSNETKLALSRNPYGGVAPLLDDCVTAVIDQVIINAGGPAWGEAAFGTLAESLRGNSYRLLYETLTQLEPILRAWYDTDRRLRSLTDISLVKSAADMREQLSGLVYAGFVLQAGLRRLPDLTRYLRGMEHRLAKLPGAPQRDRERLLQLEEVLQEYAEVKARIQPGAPGWDMLAEVRWMIEELRISYFAQPIGTAFPVSDVRIFRTLGQL